MAAVALLKFSQGALIGSDGEALVGEVGTSVTIENADNTDVASWQIDLVYTPPGSSIPVATPYALNDNDSTPTALLLPDVSGCYRIVLTVYESINRTGPSDVDIRVFGIPEAKHGFILPPFQDFPKPLPLLGSGEPGEKPNELNFGGQSLGWHGEASTNSKLIHQILRELSQSNFDLLPGVSDVGTLATVSEATLVEPWFSVIDPISREVVFFNSSIPSTIILSAIPAPTPQVITVDSTSIVTKKVIDLPIFEGDSATAIGTAATDENIWVSYIDAAAFESYWVNVTLGPTASSPIANNTTFPVNGDFDGTDLWFVDFSGGTLDRYNATTPGTPTGSIAPTAFFTDCRADKDTANYGDTQRRVWAADGGFLRRVELTTPAVDTSIDINTAVGSDPQFVAVGGGYIWAITTAGVLCRNTPDPAAFDTSVDLTIALGAHTGVGLEYDTVNDKLYYVFVDGVGTLNVAKVDAASLVVDTTSAFTGTSDALTPTVGISVRFGFANGFAWIPQPEGSVARGGKGWRVSLTGALAPTQLTYGPAVQFLPLRYGIQTIDGSGVWDGRSQIVIVTNGGGAVIDTSDPTLLPAGTVVRFFAGFDGTINRTDQLEFQTGFGAPEILRFIGPQGVISWVVQDTFLYNITPIVPGAPGGVMQMGTLSDTSFYTSISPELDGGGGLILWDGDQWVYSAWRPNVLNSALATTEWDRIADQVELSSFTGDRVVNYIDPHLTASPDGGHKRSMVLETTGTCSPTSGRVTLAAISGTSNVMFGPEVIQTPHGSIEVVWAGAQAASSNQWRTIRKYPDYTELTPAVLTSSQNDYFPLDAHATGRPTWASATHVRLDADSFYEITGFARTGLSVINVSHYQKKLINISSLYYVRLVHESGSSVAANRIFSPSGLDYDLQPNQSVDIVYDHGISRWRILTPREVHLDISAEIYGLTLSPFPAADDIVMIEVAGSSYSKAKTTVGTLTGQVVISPATITANQNNYNPTGFATADVVRLASDASRDITGLQTTQLTNWRLTKRLINVGANDIVLRDLDGSSDAANQFLIAGGDLTLSPNQSVVVFVDVTTAKVRVLKEP